MLHAADELAARVAVAARAGRPCRRVRSPARSPSERQRHAAADQRRVRRSRSSSASAGAARAGRPSRAFVRRLSASAPESWRRSFAFVAGAVDREPGAAGRDDGAARSRPRRRAPAGAAPASCRCARPGSPRARRARWSGRTSPGRCRRPCARSRRSPSVVVRSPPTSVRPRGLAWRRSSRRIAQRARRRGSARPGAGRSRAAPRAPLASAAAVERRHPDLVLAAAEVGRVAVGRDQRRERVHRPAAGAARRPGGGGAELHDRLGQHERGHHVVGERVGRRVRQHASRAAAGRRRGRARRGRPPAGRAC